VKRILFAYRFCNLGGVASVIKQRLPALRAAGWSVTCLFERDDGGMVDLERAGVDAVRITKRQLPQAFVDEAGGGHYQALVVFDTPSVLARAVQDGLPVCYEMHTSLERGLKGLEESDLLQARCVVVPSEWSRQWLSVRFPHLAPDQLRVCPNIVSLPNDTGVARWDCGDGPLLWVGKLAASKQWREMLRVAAVVVAQRPETRIFCVTGGGLEAARSVEFLAEAQALGVSDRLRWLHNLGHESLMALYRSAASRQGVLLSASRRESFCFAVHEAAWTGLPVVAAPAGAVRDVIRDGENGCLYRPGDHREAAGKVLGLMGDAERHEAMGRAARETVSRRWSPGLLAADYLSLVNRLRPNAEMAGVYEDFAEVLGDGPRVSVVMTAFNAADTIAGAIRSVLAQTEADLELIVVDDASEDGTVDVVNSLSAEDDRVRLLTSGRNRGTYWAKNRGILGAAGRYIALHDADDESSPERLAVQAEALDASPNQWLCYANWERLDQDGNVVLNRGRTARLGYPTAMFRRGLVSRVGFFDAVRVGADHEFHRRVRAVLGKKAIVHVEKTLYRAPLSADSLTGQNPVNMELSDSSDPASYLSESRRAYIAAFSRWHGSGDRLFMPFPPRERYIDSPPALRTGLYLPRAGIDLVIDAMESDGNGLDSMIRQLLPLVDRVCLKAEFAWLADDWVNHPQIQVEPDTVMSGKYLKPARQPGTGRVRVEILADASFVLPLIRVLAEVDFDEETVPDAADGKLVNNSGPTTLF